MYGLYRMSMCIARALGNFKCEGAEHEMLSLVDAKIKGLLSSGICRLEGRENSVNCCCCCSSTSGTGSAFGTEEGEWVSVVVQGRPLSTCTTGLMSSGDGGMVDPEVSSSDEPGINKMNK